MSRAAIDDQAGIDRTATRRAVRWVLREFDLDIPTLVVRILLSEYVTHHGRFYQNAYRFNPRVWSRNSADVPESAKHLIVGFASEFPAGVHDRKMRGGPPPIDPEDWIESVVAITTHEAMHARQFLYPKPGAPRWSELEAEWAEFRLLKRWRERSEA